MKTFATLCLLGCALAVQLKEGKTDGGLAENDKAPKSNEAGQGPPKEDDGNKSGGEGPKEKKDKKGKKGCGKPKKDKKEKKEQELAQKDDELDGPIRDAESEDLDALEEGICEKLRELLPESEAEEAGEALYELVEGGATLDDLEKEIKKGMKEHLGMSENEANG